MKIRANILPAIQAVRPCLDSGLDLIGRDGRQSVDLAERVGFEPTWGIYAPIRFRVGAVMTASVPLREESLGANAEEFYILPYRDVLPIP